MRYLGRFWAFFDLSSVSPGGLGAIGGPMGACRLELRNDDCRWILGGITGGITFFELTFIKFWVPWGGSLSTRLIGADSGRDGVSRTFVTRWWPLGEQPEFLKRFLVSSINLRVLKWIQKIPLIVIEHRFVLWIYFKIFFRVLKQVSTFEKKKSSVLFGNFCPLECV